MRQTSRLARLSDYLHGKGRSMYMFELLVPALKNQLEGFKGDKGAHDLELRPQLMVQAIEQLQDAHVEADVWKIEGLDRPADCEKVVATAPRNGRPKVGCIVLGRGENKAKIRDWLTTAAGVPGFIGFAVGRTSFWEPLLEWRDGKITRKQAMAAIANRYRQYVDVFEKKARAAA